MYVEERCKQACTIGVSEIIRFLPGTAAPVQKIMKVEVEVSMCRGR